MMKTGLARNAQKTKECVSNIPHIMADVTSAEVCIKEHKYNLTQNLLQKSKLPQHA
jgi:hypothetical protein